MQSDADEVEIALWRSPNLPVHHWSNEFATKGIHGASMCGLPSECYDARNIFWGEAGNEYHVDCPVCLRLMNAK